MSGLESCDQTDSVSAERRKGWALSVAPMMDWTDSVCRNFHRVLAPSARLYTEMVHAQAVIHGDRQRLLGFDPAEHPVALQLGGSDPALLAQATKIGADWGYDEVNLNVGCPSDRVQAGRFGACLMREPLLVAECIAAMREVVDIPVTVKCRLGVDDQEEYETLRDFVDTVAGTGCDTFVVHARKAWLKGLSPKENREIPPLRYEHVYRLKQERPALRIVINGGIAEVASMQAHLLHVEGVMIGRAAYHDPYVLHLMDAALTGSEPRQRQELLLDFLPWVEAQITKGLHVKHVTRHILGLFHGQPGGRLFRQILSEGASKAGADASLILRALEVTQRSMEII